MFDPLFETLAKILAFFYELPVIGGSYGLAIILLTLTVMVVLMPLTLKATKSTIRMQQVQPELKALQKKHKDDRQKLNQETMALYQRHGINPVGGCLPMLAQAPVFFVMWRVFLGLTQKKGDTAFFGVADALGVDQGAAEQFNPKYLPQNSEMFQDLANSTTMSYGPVDLAAKPGDIVQDNFFSAIPYLILILIVVGGSYYQQKQITARRGDSPVAANPAMEMMTKIFPLMAGIWGFIFPTALLLYQAASSLFRIGQQGYITRSLYKGDESVGQKALRASDEFDHSTLENDDDSTSENGTGKKKPGNKNGSGTGNKAKKKTKAKEKAGVSVGSDDQPDAAAKHKQWSERRAKKAKEKNLNERNGSASGRTTPKGTKPSGAKKKRKR